MAVWCGCAGAMEECESGEDGDKLCCICHDPVDGQSADDVSDVLECHKVGQWPVPLDLGDWPGLETLTPLPLYLCLIRMSACTRSA